MDLNEWKRLSRSEKERVWDTLSAAEKEMVRRHRSGKSRGGRASRAASGRGASHGMVPFLFRVAASAAALAAALLMVVDIPLLNQRTLLLLIITCAAAGFAILIEQHTSLIEELRELNARNALREQREASRQHKAPGDTGSPPL